jgi:hypothetical protein
VGSDEQEWPSEILSFEGTGHPQQTSKLAVSGYPDSAQNMWHRTNICHNVQYVHLCKRKKTQTNQIPGI